MEFVKTDKKEKFRMPQVVGALLAYIAAKKNNQQILLKICYDKL